MVFKYRKESERSRFNFKLRKAIKDFGGCEYILDCNSKVTCADCTPRYKEFRRTLRVILECEYILGCNSKVTCADCADCTPQHKRIVARILAAKAKVDGGESAKQVREYLNVLEAQLKRALACIIAEAKASRGKESKPSAD